MVSRYDGTVRDAIPGVVVLVAMVAGLALWTIAVWRASTYRAAVRALRSGQARRARAMARLHARRRLPYRAKFRLLECECLFWEGDFSRAAAWVRARMNDAEFVQLGIEPFLLQVECLAFAGQMEEARARFRLCEAEVSSKPRLLLRASVVAAMFCLHDGDLENAEAAFDLVAQDERGASDACSVAQYFLAIIAQRRHLLAVARMRLAALASQPGDHFIARQARANWTGLFPGAPAPPVVARPRAARVARAGTLKAHLRFGVAALVRASGEVPSFTMERTCLLALLNVGIVLAARLVEGASLGILPSSWGATFPVLAFPILLYLATRGISHLELGRLLGATYAAMPALLALGEMGVHAIANQRGRLMFGVLIATWAVVVVANLIVRLTPRAPRFARFRASMLVVVLWIGLGHLPSNEVVATESEPIVTPDPASVYARALEQAERVRAAEDALAMSTTTKPQMYFVGMAAWAHQDVFGREVRAARQLFDDRFDTRGRSVVLSNDPSTMDTLPLATNANLRHVLRFVASRMNREQDMLFLFVTSHGSSSGVALGLPRSGDLPETILTPDALRTMLDEAGIKWRILVISGCRSRVFASALQNEYSLVATAAAPHRHSFGCASGRDYTEYGRALFAEAFVQEPNMVSAFSRAHELVELREKARGDPPSRPQLSVGSAVPAKLTQMELNWRLGEHLPPARAPLSP